MNSSAEPTTVLSLSGPWLETLPYSAALLDNRGDIVATNAWWRAFARDNGGDPNGYPHWNYLDVLRQAGEEGASELADRLAGVLAGRTNLVEWEYPCHGPRQNRWFLLTATPIRDSDGGYALVAHLDITRRQRLEEIARHREQQLESLLAHTREGFVVVEPDGTIRYANPRAGELLDTEPQLLVGQQLGVPIASEATQVMELLPSSQDSRTVEVSAARAEWEGEPAWLVHLHDITDQERATLALRQNEDLLERTNQVARVGGWEADLRTGELQWTAVTRDILGVTREENAPPLDQALARFYPGESYATVTDYLHKVVEEGVAIQFETRLQRTDGEFRWVRISASPELHHGETVRLVGTFQDITEQRQADEALGEKAHLVELASRIAKLGGWSVDLEAGWVDWSDEVCAIHEMPAGTRPTLEEAISYIAPEWQPRLRHAFRQCAEAGVPYDEELEVLTASNQRKWVRAIGEAVYDDTGRIPKVRGAFQDITERKAMEIQLAEWGSAFAATGEGVIITDATTRIVAVNPAFTSMTGYSEAEVLGHTPRFLQSGRHGPETYEPMWRTLREEGQWQGEILDLRKNGEIFPAWQTINTITDGTGKVTHYVSVLSDLSQLKEAESQLEHLAYHDPLTELPNRRLFADRLDQALAQSRRSGETIGVLLVDLDDFKALNDGFGHDIGDQALIILGERLPEVLREGDTVARWGGDEFAILARDLSETSDVTRVAERVLEAVETAFPLGAQEFRLGASIGIALGGDAEATSGSLIMEADSAMYQAKSTGQEVAFFSEELGRAARERLFLGTELARALENGDLRLHYQPQVDLANGARTDWEALLRWPHSTEGWISPARFIPVAEKSGLILRLGRWVLEEACRQGRQWLDEGRAFGRIAVNVAPPQLDGGGLRDLVERVLEKTGLPADRLELELTETCLVDQSPENIDDLRALREIGVTVALDDFGTGYSSLGYLKTLPVDRLKIDRSFIEGIPGDTSDLAIVRTVMALADSLGFSVIAEGIETPEQRQALLGEGCQHGQGFLFEGPMDPDESPPPASRHPG